VYYPVGKIAKKAVPNCQKYTQNTVLNCQKYTLTDRFFGDFAHWVLNKGMFYCPSKEPKLILLCGGFEVVHKSKHATVHLFLLFVKY